MRRLGPIFMFKEASVALIAGCLFLGSLPVAASASGPKPGEPEPIVLAGTERVCAWRACFEQRKG